VIPELTASQRRVVVFHLPLLTRDMNESDYTFDYIASELKRVVVDKLHIPKFHIVGESTNSPSQYCPVCYVCVITIGESFGGIIGQHVAFNYPDIVDKLVVLSSLAKTELPPEIQWKLDNLFPIINNLGESVLILHDFVVHPHSNKSLTFYHKLCVSVL
jgi:pimeloyl-ACP methyl ester carboxylesterase